MSQAPKSSPQAMRPRAPNKGSLNADDDPLSSPKTPPATRFRPRDSSLPTGEDAPRRTATTSRDFSFLLRPEVYHPLTALNAPPAFRSSSRQPDAADRCRPEDLLARGHFRAAAVAAVQELTGAGAASGRRSVGPHDARRIFDLVYARLACLVLMDATPLAAQEARALGDLGGAANSVYVDEATGEHLVPWPLRVLTVRLQALGFGDPRRAVMSYHELAREARARIAGARAAGEKKEEEEKGDGGALWRARLHELGVRVAAALVDMDDLSGAAHLLRGLRPCHGGGGGDARLEMSRALLWLQLGDAGAARACARNCTADNDDDAETTTEQVVLALCDMAESDFDAALAKWQALRSRCADEMASVNAATCLLYLGRIAEGRDILEELVDKGHSSRTLLFNLTTMYELCTERNRDLKVKLTERVAAMDESPVGWEKTMADFKL